MSNNPSKLKAKELHRLLDHLHDYLQSEKLCIKARKSLPDVSGNIIHLDGDAFLASFREYIETLETQADRYMDDLDMLMELSIYVRNGGIKAIMYRLETGNTGVTLDIFDSIASVLTRHWQSGKFTPEDVSLFQHLQTFSAEDESRVSAMISELDEYLLELSRRLEDISLQKLEKMAAATELSSGTENDKAEDEVKDKEQVKVKYPDESGKPIDQTEADLSPEEKR